MAAMLRDELRTTAELAMLELDDTEALEQAVLEMLTYFSKMMEMNVDDLAPTTHALVTGNRVRPDDVSASEVVDELVDKAPRREDRFFRIPSVL
jgi:aspartyl-tRNA(Asn)/glutamyl-tRNA(Gln) amidotransferase subunit C